MNRYTLRKEPEYDTPWIALPNNGGDVGDMADITCELNKLLGNYEVAMDDRDELRDAVRAYRDAKGRYHTQKSCKRLLSLLPENVKEHATLSAGASVDHGVEVETTGGHENRAADRGCCVSSCSLFSIRESMLYAACDSEEGIILTPMNGTEIVLNDAEAKQLGEWLLHITSQDSRSRRSVDSSVTAACPSDDSTPNS